MRGGRPFAPFGFPVLVLLIGLASTALVGIYLERAFAAEDAERFEVAADRLEDSIRERLETYVAMLRAEAGLLGATDMPTAAEFRTFVSRLELPTRYRGLQGIGYTARIAPDALASVEARRRADSPDFRVWPAHARDEYHAILYLEPMDRRNAAALGYDMFTEPIRREAMERARDSGEPAASGRVTLVQEIDEQVQAGFLIYVPVYESGNVPTSVDQRRARLRGFVYSPFRAGDLFEGILGRNPRPRVGFQFYDGDPATGQALYETPPPETPPRFVTRRAIRLAGREWNASVFSTAALERTAGAGLLPLAMWGGVGVSLLLTALATLQAHARRRAELSEAAAAQASRQLQTQAETLAIVHRSGTQLAAELDLDRLLQAVVDTATQLTGAQVGLFFCNATLPEPGAYARYVATDTPRHLRGRLSEGDGPFRNVLLPSSIVRVDDLTGNPRAADEASAAGLPTQMRSYLAVPVRSRGGTPLGALLFGHATAGAFSSQSEDIVGGIAAQTAIAVDNACLYGQVQQLLTSEREARENAERVSRLKDEFLATLSHELRTPLNAVIGWAHMLSGGRLDEARQRTALDAVLRNARVQSQLIEDLLDMSRIISGRVRIEMAHMDLQTVTRAAVDVLTPTAAARRVAVHFEPPATPCVVRGDAGRLQQVAWNLLSNAIKFTAPGGRVDLDLECRDDQVSLTVTDSGMGIDPAFLPHVFDRFRQADSSLTRGHGGLGLGLSIVRSLVDMHGGTVSAQSDGLNRGASFTVTLPGAPRGAVAADSVTGQTPAARPASSVLEGLQILVVEDDADARELTSDILRLHGARVHVAASGIDALHLLEAHDLPVDLIVSDIGMPQLDGYTLIGRIRALPGRQVSRAPAVALTAYAGAEDQQRALAAGFDVHLAKPFTPDELVAACEALAGQSRQIRSSRS